MATVEYVRFPSNNDIVIELKSGDEKFSNHCVGIYRSTTGLEVTVDGACKGNNLDNVPEIMKNLIKKPDVLCVERRRFNAWILRVERSPQSSPWHEILDGVDGIDLNYLVANEFLRLKEDSDKEPIAKGNDLSKEVVDTLERFGVKYTEDFILCCDILGRLEIMSPDTLLEIKTELGLCHSNRDGTEEDG